MRRRQVYFSQLSIFAAGFFVLAAMVLVAAIGFFLWVRADRYARAASAEGPAAGQPATSVLGPTPTGPIPGDLSPTPVAFTHFVQDGETVDSIAALYGIPPDQLALANNLTMPYQVFPGQSLTIPMGIRITAAPSPTADPPTAAPAIDTSNPLAEYSIPALAARPYNGMTIIKDRQNPGYTAYDQWSFTYTSDQIYVTGLMNIPKGDGPFPVAIVLHGGIDQSVYAQGDGSREHADILARNGYLALMPDYRTYNNTGGSGTPLKIPWAIDVMNLIEALPTLPEADPLRIGVMGHSRGGGIASYIMVISDQVDAVVLYASLHTNQAVVWEQYHTVYGSSWPAKDAAIVGTPTENPEGYAMVSPSSYLDWVSMPVQIHHGAQDTVTPVAWSRDLNERLLEVGKQTEYFEYPEANHTFYNADYDLFMSRVVAFFDANVK